MNDYSHKTDAQPRAHVVLLVEDEVLIRAYAAEGLRQQGFKVVEAASADEAIGLVAAGIVPEVLFTDVRMPGTRDGLQLAKDLQEAHPDLIVFIASANLDANVGDTLGERFFPKPYDLDLIVAKMRAALGD